MDAETLAALKGSIKKWEEIVCHDGVDDGTANCPLCQKFRIGYARCLQCPVYKCMGISGCRGTPYIPWYDAIWRYKYDVIGTINAPHIAYTDELAELAKKELEFLRSLLPEEEG